MNLSGSQFPSAGYLSNKTQRDPGESWLPERLIEDEHGDVRPAAAAKICVGSLESLETTGWPMPAPLPCSEDVEDWFVPWIYPPAAYFHYSWAAMVTGKLASDGFVEYLCTLANALLPHEPSLPRKNGLQESEAERSPADSEGNRSREAVESWLRNVKEAQPLCDVLSEEIVEECLSNGAGHGGSPSVTADVATTV